MYTCVYVGECVHESTVPLGAKDYVESSGYGFTGNYKLSEVDM